MLRTFLLFKYHKNKVVWIWLFNKFPRVSQKRLFKILNQSINSENSNFIWLNIIVQEVLQSYKWGKWLVQLFAQLTKWTKNLRKSKIPSVYKVANLKKKNLAWNYDSKARLHSHCFPMILGFFKENSKKNHYAKFNTLKRLDRPKWSK